MHEVTFQRMNVISYSSLVCMENQKKWNVQMYKPVFQISAEMITLNFILTKWKPLENTNNGSVVENRINTDFINNQSTPVRICTTFWNDNDRYNTTTTTTFHGSHIHMFEEIRMYIVLPYKLEGQFPYTHQTFLYSKFFLKNEAFY